jgi:hypothetical protein
MIYNNSITMGASNVKIRDYNLNTFHFPHFFISTLFELPEVTKMNFEKEKDFLILNRRLGFNKFKLLKAISDRNLLDKCLYTILSVLPDTTYNLNKYSELSDVSNRIGLYRLPIGLSNDIASAEDVIKDDTYLYKLNTDAFFKTKINIISETFLDYRNDDRFSDTIHITEKTWKAIHIGVPFIISATNGHIETLHKFGFKTFGDFWNEDYDDKNDDLRISRIGKLLADLDSLGAREKNQLQRHLAPVVEHNFQWFYSQEFESLLWQELTSTIKQW